MCAATLLGSLLIVNECNQRLLMCVATLLGSLLIVNECNQRLLMCVATLLGSLLIVNECNQRLLMCAATLLGSLVMYIYQRLLITLSHLNCSILIYQFIFDQICLLFKLIAESSKNYFSEFVAIH